MKTKREFPNITQTVEGIIAHCVRIGWLNDLVVFASELNYPLTPEQVYDTLKNDRHCGIPRLQNENSELIQFSESLALAVVDGLAHYGDTSTALTIAKKYDRFDLYAIIVKNGSDNHEEMLPIFLKLAQRFPSLAPDTLKHSIDWGMVDGAVSAAKIMKRRLTKEECERLCKGNVEIYSDMKGALKAARLAGRTLSMDEKRTLIQKEIKNGTPESVLRQARAGNYQLTDSDLEALEDRMGAFGIPILT